MSNEHSFESVPAMKDRVYSRLLIAAGGVLVASVLGSAILGSDEKDSAVSKPSRPAPTQIDTTYLTAPKVVIGGPAPEADRAKLKDLMKRANAETSALQAQKIHVQRQARSNPTSCQTALLAQNLGPQSN